MRFKAFFVGLTAFVSVGFAQYLPDELGPGFYKKIIRMPDDYEGKVVCSMVKRKNQKRTERAILYVHGYNDYFFQTEMANRFTRAGYNFYAVDLRKYGRSLLKGQFPTNARNLNEYFADIDTVITLIKREGNKKVFLIGHSTGGLITSLYADAKGRNLPISGLILNSPFFDFNENGWNENVAIPLVSLFSGMAKDVELSGGSSTAYGESLHKKYHGEWQFDLNKKKLASGAKRLCWIAAIHAGHKKVQSGLNIACPVLSMSSDKSVTGDPWNSGYQTADGVLDVKDIQRYSRNIGRQTTIRIIPGGMHDLILSKPNVREAVYREMINWLSTIR